MMRVVDIDPELLRRSAEAELHAAEEGGRHVLSEIEGWVPAILETLAPEGPYGYTVRQEVLPDGALKVPIQTTREEIHEEYKFVRGMCDVLTHDPVVDIRGAWYLFQEVVNTGRLKGSYATADTTADTYETLVLLPVKTGKGITGEIFWHRTPREALGQGPTPAEIPDRQTLRLENLALHDRYMDALRSADVDGMLSAMNDSVQLAVRDYVNDTGTLTQPDSKTTYGDYWQAFFAKYDIESVDLLERVIEEWYVFAEQRLTLRRRKGGESVAFHTAEFFIPAKDSLFIAQIGHGSDEAPAG
jgi:hypothetical protein